MCMSVQEVSNDVASQEIIAKEVTEFMLTAGSVRVSGCSTAAQQSGALLQLLQTARGLMGTYLCT